MEATTDRVNISNSRDVLATHLRSFDRGQTIEDSEHLNELSRAKRKAHKHRAMDRIRTVVPSSEGYFKRAAERGHNLGRLTQMLVQMLDLYGALELEAAIAETMAVGAYHSASIQKILERNRLRKGKELPVALRFAQRKLNELTVIPSGLEKYDQLIQEEEDND